MQQFVSYFEKYDEPNTNLRLDVQHLLQLRLGPYFEYLPYMEEIERELSTMKIKRGGDFHSLREEVFVKSKAFASLKLLTSSVIQEDPVKFVAAIIVLSKHNASFCARNLIHYLFCAGTIYELGTTFHREKFLPLLDDYTCVGSLAITEIGTGSNINKIETTATYDEWTDEFILNSPSISSLKFWIGNLAQYGNLCVVFAQLKISGVNKGVHAFVVPIRDFTTHEKPLSIEIGDCGLKIALNGVDHGYIRFRNHRIPRENLLNRFANVTEYGEYQSVISKPKLLLHHTLNQLKLGRLSYISISISSYSYALYIALHFAHKRKQVNHKSESLIIDNQSYQRKIIPKLAENIAFDFARNAATSLLLDYNNYYNNPNYTYHLDNSSTSTSTNNNSQPNNNNTTTTSNNNNNNNNTTTINNTSNNNNNTQSTIIEEEEEEELDINNKKKKKREYYHSMVAGLKSLICDQVAASISELRTLTGGFGFSEHTLIGELYREVDLLRTVEGDSLVLKQQLSKYVLKNYMNEMAGISGFLKYIGGEIGTAIFEKNPLVTRNCSTEYLSSKSFQCMAFQYRVHSLLLSISKKLKNLSNMVPPPSTFDMYNSCQYEMTKLSDAYAQLFILDSFVSAIEKCDHREDRPPPSSSDSTPKPIKKTLTLFCSLYALHSIEADMGFYRNNGYIGSRQGEAITNLVTKLCTKLTKYSLPFLSSNFPNIANEVPLTRDDYLTAFLDVIKAEELKFPPYRIPSSL